MVDNSIVFRNGGLPQTVPLTINCYSMDTGNNPDHHHELHHAIIIIAYIARERHSSVEGVLS